MKQFNRKPLFLGLALAAAAPFAFAQSTTPQTTQSTDTQSTETQSQSTQSSTTQPTQSQDAQSTTTQSTTDTQSTTATQSDTGASTTDAMASQSKTGYTYSTVNSSGGTPTARQVPNAAGLGPRADYILMKGITGSTSYTNVYNWSYNGTVPTDHNLVYSDIQVPTQ